MHCVKLRGVKPKMAKGDYEEMYTSFSTETNEYNVIVI